MDTKNGRFPRNTLYLALAMVFAPAAVIAQEDEAIRDLTEVKSQVELGIGYVNRGHWKFGEYNGLGDKGAYLIGNVDLWGRDRASATWWNLNGTNLGLTSRNLRFDMGTQGNYRVWAEYDQLEKLGNDSGRTPFNGVGSNTLTLPAGFAGIAAAGETVATRAAKLEPFMQRLELNQERQNYILGASKLFASNWEVKANLRHEKKEGLKLAGAVFGNSGGNPRAILIPEPVDYNTNHLDLALGYAGERSQFQVVYNLSVFDNSNRSTRWQNPYQVIGGWTAPNAGFPTGIGELAQPPDNQFHQIGVNGGYNFSPTTRFGYNVAVGRMTQDERFLPYTTDPGVVIHSPLPRDSLDGKVNTTLVNLNFSTRPIRSLTLRGSYRFDDRDDRTPQAQYIYIGGDSQSPQSGLASDRARTNLPLSYRQNLVKLDADYQLLPGTKLNAGYDYDEIRRKNTEVDKTKENTVRVGARRTLSETVTGGINYAHSRRRHDGYVGNAPFLLSYSPEYQASASFATPGTLFDNNPLLRKFTYANRDRDKLRFNLSATPTERIALGFATDVYKDEYDDTLLGLQDAKGTTYTFDAAFTPMEKLTTYAFYTRDQFKTHQQGRQFTNAAAQKVPAGSEIVNLRDWFVDMKSKADTVGIGFNLNEFRSRLDFGGDIAYTESTGSVTPMGGAGWTTVVAPYTAVAVPLPLPDSKTRLTSLQLFAKYRYTKNVSTKVTFLRQLYRESDWSWDNVGPTTMANVISTGQQPPRYAVTAIGMSVTYEF